MVQILATTFFSATALGALGVIGLSLAENAAEVRRALGFAPTRPVVTAARVRVRRVVALHGIATARPGSPLRAAA